MKTSKRILSMALAAALMSGAVAINAQDVTETTDAPMLIAQKPVYAVHIDGNLVELNTFVDGDTVMIPLRSICEALGYEVIWHSETEPIEVVKMPQYITLTLGVDGYTFSRTAPMPLGKAPVLANDKTFVPVNFISEILHLELAMADNGEINIVTAEKEESAEETVTEEAATGKGTIKVDGETISVNDENRGEVVLNISDETVIENEAGEKLDKSALVDGANVTVEYSDAMTLSLPPINNPVKVVIHAAGEDKTDVVEKLTGKGVVKVDGETISVIDETRGEVVLNISDETVIENENGEKLDKSALVDGAVVSVEYSDAMTLSLPPINNPVKITVVSE